MNLTELKACLQQGENLDETPIVLSSSITDLELQARQDLLDLEPEVQAEFPPKVLREILVNALAHRDYTMSAPIRVIVYDDRLEVRSPGLLPISIKLESLGYGMRVLRNPIIYNMLLRVGLVTDAGSGIPRIIRLTRQATGQEPAFRLEGNEFVVSLPRRNNGNGPQK
ncbi:MAG: ATP-binding protein [bacterium]